MNRRISLLLAFLLLLLLPVQGLAKKMEEGVPIWTEESVRQYLQSYIEGEELDQLYGYYDIQIRRYMPETTYRNMLSELKWLTGAFQSLGSYESFAEDEHGTMTHVVHLHMEKQDLDAYLTHKNTPDDREIMSLEFVPAPEEKRDLGFAVGEEENTAGYRELSVCIGEDSPYPLQAVVALPDGGAGDRVLAGCVFVHDAGPLDRDGTVGDTHFFADLAQELAQVGVASIRYEKRTFAYDGYQPETVRDEVIEDALLAAGLLSRQAEMAGKPVILLGHGFGAALLPRIAQESSFAGMILIGSKPGSYAEQLLADLLATAASEDEKAMAKQTVASLPKMSQQEAQETELFGRNAVYFWDLEQHDPIKLIKQLALPTYIVQGREDASVTEEEGWKAYQEALKECRFVSYNCYRGLNHILARDLSLNADGKPEYAIDAGIEPTAVRDLVQWIRRNLPQAKTMEVEE